MFIPLFCTFPGKKWRWWIWLGYHH